ncbi:MucR family transcriptional regulator [Lactococcus garvieae]
MSKTDVELTAEIVKAYLSNPSVTYKSSSIPDLIKNVHEAIAKLY